MSNSITDLYDCDLVKKCCRCKNILLKSNFHKDNKRKDGLYNQCKVCRKEYYMKNSNKLIQIQKDFYSENRDSELEPCKKYKILNREKKNFILIININQILIFNYCVKQEVEFIKL